MNDITHVEPQAIAVAEPSIASIIASAVQSGRSPEELRELMAFAKELRAETALSEFNKAMAEFRKACPKIVKRTENPQFTVTRDGVKRPNRFASMADIDDAIGKPLSAVGLSFTFTDADTTSEPGKMKLGAIISHAAGHVAAPKYVTMPCDTGGAGSSPQQKVGSVMQYCMRYALTAALGLVGCDDDDVDGNATNGEKITEEQAHSLNDALIQVQAKMPAFLGMFKIEKLSDLPASKYNDAWKKIQDKKAGMKT